MPLHPVDAILTLAERACLGAGASAAMARSLSRASVSASTAGRHEVGLSHLLDHLRSLQTGRIDGAAVPVIESPAPALFSIDARDGVAQLGFDLVFDQLVDRAKTFGLALVAQRNSYPSGELGYFARRLAEAGLIGMAAGNAQAFMAVAAQGGKVFSTNPLAFGVPLCGRPPLLIDQASSSTAFVNIRRAAESNRPIPAGWALDAQGAPTTDATAALTGALLPFGGYKGANIALMVEVLSAGLTGAKWSPEVGNFMDGTTPPRSGMFALALSPNLCDPDFSRRLTDHLDLLAQQGLHVPGQSTRQDGLVDVPDAVLAELHRYAG